MEAAQAPGMRPKDLPVTERLRITLPFLLSARALSLLGRGARLGELRHARLLQQRGPRVVDALGGVVGVEALHGRGERCQQTLQSRQRKVLGNALDAAGELVLQSFPKVIAPKTPDLGRFCLLLNGPCCKDFRTTL